MVHNMHGDCYRTSDVINTWMAQNQGQSVVLTLANLRDDTWHLYSFDSSSRPKKPTSVVICTYGRPESLNATLTSLTKQTYRNFEVLLITEKGNLAALRQKGLASSNGDIVSLIDDDVYCEPTWLESVLTTFQGNKEIVGVTGPTTIAGEYRNNRDLFKYRLFKRLYDILFLGKLKDYPSRLSSCGTPSTASNDYEISYSGPCDFLEACNMSVKKKEALDVGGFDGTYYRTSEWCEVDLALKLKARGNLYFNPRAMLYHRPSKAGIYANRLSTQHRWDNFIHFQQRWIKPSIRTYLYRGFVWCYMTMKNMRMI